MLRIWCWLSERKVYKDKTVEIDGVVYKEGDYISLNGTTGQVYAGEVPTKAAEPER